MAIFHSYVSLPEGTKWDEPPSKHQWPLPLDLPKVLRWPRRQFRGDTLDAGERGDAARGDAAGDGLPRRRSSGSVPSRGNLNGIEETNEKMGAWSDKHCEIWMKTLFWRNKWRFHMTWKAFGVQEFLPFCRCCKLTFVWKKGILTNPNQETMP